jgi:hypothetical protein
MAVRNKCLGCELKTLSINNASAYFISVYYKLQRKIYNYIIQLQSEQVYVFLIFI